MLRSGPGLGARLAALLALVALAVGAPAALAAKTTGGTVISNTATATYTDANDNVRSATSNTVETTVQTVYALSVTPGAADTPASGTAPDSDWTSGVGATNDLDQVNPGGEVWFEWDVTNGTNGPAYIAPTFIAKGDNPFALTSWTLSVWGDDDNGNGAVDVDELDPVSGSIRFEQESTRTFVVRGTVDPGATAAGLQALFDLQIVQHAVDASGGIDAAVDFDNNNLAGVTLPEIDLSTTTAIADPNPAVGGSVEATVTVANASTVDDDATGVRASVTLPDGLTATGVTVDGATVTLPTPSTDATTGASTYEFDLADLAPGASVAIVMTGTVDAANATGGLPGQTLRVSADIVASDQLDPVPGNDASFDDLVVQSADLAITKTVDVASATYGDEVAYTLTVANDGPNAATDVVVTDDLPDGLEFVSVAPSVGTVVDAATDAAPVAGSVGPTLDWEIGALGDGATATLVIRARVVAAGAIGNSATVTSSGPGDPYDDDDTDDATVNATAADLSLTGSVDAAVADVDDHVTFTWSVTNDGPHAPDGVSVSGLLPAGFAWVSDTGGGAFDAATGVWTLPGSVGVGAANEVALQITAAPVASAAGSTLSVDAEIAASSLGDPDSTPADGSTDEDDDASVEVRVTEIDLSLAADVAASATGPWNPSLTAAEGDTVYFRTTVANAAPFDDATGIVVDGVLPAGVTFVEVVGTLSGTFDPDAASGTWTIDALASGGSATLVIAAIVDADSASAASYGAAPEVAAADQADDDSTPDNDAPAEDDQGATSLAVPYVDAAITAFSAAPAASAGDDLNARDEVVFTITVANQTDQPGTGATATGVEIADVLPAGVTYVSHSSTLAGVQYVDGDLTGFPGIPAAGSVTVEIVATVVPTYSGDDLVQSPIGVGHAIEVSALGRTDVDSEPGNGDPTEDDWAALSASLDPLDSDIELTKTLVSFDITDPAAPAGTSNPYVVVFDLAIENRGETALSGIDLQDDLDAVFGAGGYLVSDLALVDAGGGLSVNPSYSGASGEPLVSGSLAAGGSATVTLTVHVYSDGTYTNTATVTGTDPGGNDVRDTSGSVQAALGSLGLVKEQSVCTAADAASCAALLPTASWSTTDGLPVAPGNHILYRITATAQGAAVENVKLLDVVPVGLDPDTLVPTGASTVFVSASAETGLTADIDCRVDDTGTEADWVDCAAATAADVLEVRWGLGTLAADDPASVYLIVFVP